MNDAYAWGIWKTFNVMTLTGLGSGAFAIGISAWLFKKSAAQRDARRAANQLPRIPVGPHPARHRRRPPVEHHLAVHAVELEPAFAAARSHVLHAGVRDVAAPHGKRSAGIGIFSPYKPTAGLSSRSAKRS